MFDPSQDSTFDMGAIEKMAASAPRLVGGLDQKLHKAPPPTEEQQQATDLEKVAWALAKIIAKAEGDWIHRGMKRLVPRENFYRAEKRLQGGDGQTMKTLLSEFEVKIVNVVPTQEQAQEDFQKGIQRRHLQLWKGPRLMREHVWEWSRG